MTRDNVILALKKAGQNCARLPLFLPGALPNREWVVKKEFVFLICV